MGRRETTRAGFTTYNVRTHFGIRMHSLYNQDVREEVGSGALFSFEGRIDTGTFWKIAVLNFVGVVIAGAATATLHHGGPRSAVSWIASGLVYGVGLWMGAATQAKRWHDMDKSGWLALLQFVPLVNFIAFLYLGFNEGTRGPNQYGDAPLKIKLL
jgi:uncharacterized membrane protein YhaH (DUF805 family)